MPKSMAVVRQQLRGWLNEAGATARELFEIQLAVAEAFANAVKHPEEPTSHLVEFKGTLMNGTVVVSVRDYGRWQYESPAREESGLGLAIMDHVDGLGRCRTIRGRHDRDDASPSCDELESAGYVSVGLISVLPPVQADSGETVSRLDVLVDRVQHLQDALIASAQIHRHRVALAFQDGIESPQRVNNVLLRRVECLGLDR